MNTRRLFSEVCQAASAGAHQADHVLETDGLPRARPAQDREGLALGDGKVDTPQHLDAVKGLVDVAELDDRVCGCGARQSNRTMSWDMKKSETSTAIEAVTTVRVVARPTPTVPPVV